MRIPVAFPSSFLFLFPLLFSSAPARVRCGRVATASADRLPDDTAPESYALAVDADPRTGTFDGRVDVAIAVAATTAAIALNARGLDLRGVEIRDVATGRSVGVRSWTYAARRERVTVDVDGHVLAGRRYVVRVRFGGRLRDDATGLFRAPYVSGGKKKWLVATQFKMTHARSAFPCYDEPRFKTPFNISIKKRENDIVLSNMPILNTVEVNETGSPNSTWVHFMETPPIPTFLVSYFVGEFENLNKDHTNLINVYSHLGTLYQMEYINGVTSSLLNVIEKYTGVKYNLPKLDLLAIPELSLKAVENWGFNTYREKSLFVDKNTKTQSKVMVKMLVEKMMAQQWFTGLVTPVQWDFAWLSEGFATYFEYFATAMIEPDWLLEHFFVVKELQTALELDQKTKYSANASAQTNESVLRNVPNNKGVAILRMLNSWVGEDVFKRALNIFLTKNQYNVVKPVHLWNAFDNALLEQTKSNLHGENVHTVMDSWTEQAGYPVVNIAKKSQKFFLTQQRFSIRTSNTEDPAKWFIQLTYTDNVTKNFDAKSTPTIWMDPTTLETTVPIANDVEWYIFNIQSLGYYRVNYMEENWASLIKQLKTSPTEIHVTNRAQLIDDSFNLARAGLLNYSIPLNLIQYLDKEDDIIPWFSAMNNLNYVLERMRRSEDGYVDVKEFVGKLAGVAFQKVNKLIADSQTVRFPINIGWNAFSTWACKLDDSGCVKIALEYFRRWRNGEEIPTDIKDAAFCTGIRKSNEEGVWRQMMDLYKSTKTYSEKESALNALACTENVQLLIANLELVLENQSSIEPNDYKAFYNALSSTPSGINALTYFLQNRSTYILQNVTDGQDMIATLYSTLAAKVSTESEIFKLSEIGRSVTSLPWNEYRDELDDNEKWFADRSTAVREFLRPGSTAVTVPEPADTTRGPPEPDSSASSRLENCVVLLQIFALSVSVKLLV